MLILLGTIIGAIVGLLTGNIFWAFIVGAATIFILNIILGD